MMMVAVMTALMLGQLHAIAKPLDTSTPLPPAALTATVVGLGEATHGSHEIAEAKIALVKKLVREGGFRDLAVEADWSELLAMENYVVRGSGEARASVLGLDFSLYRNAELLELIRWMRSYNVAHSDDLVHIVGVDVQEPAATASLAEDRSKPELAAQARAILERKRAHQSPDVLQARDATMADNVLALVDRGHRVMLWAHDGHVTAYDIMHARWITLGRHLRERLGTRYYAIATVMGGGSFRARPATGVPAIVMTIPTHRASSEAFCTGTVPFFLDLRDLTSSPQLESWFAAQQTWYLAGGTVLNGQMIGRVSYLRAFDALVCVPTVTPSHLVAS